ncbi:MAG: TrbC/VirB2 family protein [Sphingomonadaceae bacterium]|nr:TrbC/VirB2 family protein [Sphingomonadaceae bacterium]
MADLQVITGDPNALAAAVAWVTGALLGSAATTIAVLAVAALGALTMAGRLPACRAIATVVGCAIVFAAGSIAGTLTERRAIPVSDGTPSAAAAAYPPPGAQAYDPFAGAAVPVQREALPPIH